MAHYIYTKFVPVLTEILITAAFPWPDSVNDIG
jgi:hypothetical protein